jgi:hypothetical protein
MGQGDKVTGRQGEEKSVRTRDAEEEARDERWWSSGAETTIWEVTKKGRGTQRRDEGREEGTGDGGRVSPSKERFSRV